MQSAELLQLLREFLNNPSAEFRPSQFESIITLLDNHCRLLLVQKTGWGKSVVYFLATKILRKRGRGTTLLISPLIALMRNQILAAKKIGICARTINSSNQNQWHEIVNETLTDKVDVLLISPERLANSEFREKVLIPISNRLGLLVVDEAHCISDWGHDFRPDYRRIVRVIQSMPSGVPVLATTATANNRVLKDIQEQLGDSLIISRGPLDRPGLCLQNINIPDKAARMAWLAKYLPKISGNGIIYTLTVKDACQVADWLKLKGINVSSYYGDLPNKEREQLENALLENRIKALVATTALGMGFDKPDLAFVIHFQRPGSVVHYYQQVGRAGRAIPESFGILLEGEEDEDIIDYFIKSAYPPFAHVEEILRALETADDGQKILEIEKKINIPRSQIKKTFKILETEDPSPITRIEGKWHLNPINYTYDNNKKEALIAIRKREQEKMIEYVKSAKCLMEFLRRELDDPEAGSCGQCAICRGVPLLPETYDDMAVEEASRFLRKKESEIKPRSKWPCDALKEMGWTGNIVKSLKHEKGRALCKWGDAGWGKMIKEGKQVLGRFDDSLVDAATEMIMERWKPEPFPQWITYVPSLEHERLVPDFSRRLAKKLYLPLIPCIRKTRKTQPQKLMRNSYQQAKNLSGVFCVIDNMVIDKPVFLVDDMVDSRWTMTIVSALLKEAGSGPVFPFALSTTYSK